MKASRQFLSFLVAGSVGFVVDAGLTLLLVREFQWPAMLARVPAFLVSSAATYELNRRWTFEARDGSWLRRWTTYVGVTSVGALLNYLCYSLVVVALGSASATILAGVAAGSIVGLVFNFTASKRVVFK